MVQGFIHLYADNNLNTFTSIQMAFIQFGCIQGRIYLKVSTNLLVIKKNAVTSYNIDEIEVRPPPFQFIYHFFFLLRVLSQNNQKQHFSRITWVIMGDKFVIPVGESMCAYKDNFPFLFLVTVSITRL